MKKNNHVNMSNNTNKQSLSNRTLPDANSKSNNKKINKKLFIILGIEIFIMIALGGWLRWKAYVDARNVIHNTPAQQVEQTKPPAITTGKIISTEPEQVLSAAQTQALIKQTNRNFDLPVNTGMTKQVISYTSSDGNTSDIPIYAKVYLPADAKGKKLPVLSFATGTTGIGDGCAASLEQPQKRNWANYDSLMAAYASQGYAVVVADYEGMRDPARVHHYMVGDIEGRVVLDGIRALYNLDSSKNSINDEAIFTGGYSQGGHAAFWADAIADKYAPDIKLKGSIGFGPVTSVNETLTDAIVNNANINWFGPFVLTSYQDWYKRSYPVNKIIMPPWNKTIEADSTRECIDSVNQYWPNNIGVNRSAKIYTPEFIKAAQSGNIASNPIYSQFQADMESNLVGPIKTTTPKLINQGLHDNVVLPRQNRASYVRLCQSGNQVNLKEYNTSPYAIQGYNPTGLVDHYQTMNASLKDTLAWMQARIVGDPLVEACK
jgi:dienelactone hydrolase